ncbi:MAG: hypothetical protein ACR2N4_00025 [Jatrophihabitans sp.]
MELPVAAPVLPPVLLLPVLAAPVAPDEVLPDARAAAEPDVPPAPEPLTAPELPDSSVIETLPPPPPPEV